MAKTKKVSASFQSVEDLAGRCLDRFFRTLASVNYRIGIDVNGLADEVGAVVGVILRDLGGHVSDQATTAAAVASEHYGSVPLVAAKNALSTWGVTTRGAKIEGASGKDLATLSFPIVAVTKNQHLFALLAVEGEEASLFDTKRGHHKLSVDDLLAMWTGVILYTDQADPVDEPEHDVVRQAEIWRQISFPLQAGALVLTLISGITLAALTGSGQDHISRLLLLTSSLVGLGASIVLASVYVGQGEVVARLCGTDDENWSCFSVLSSRYANIAGLPYVDIGLVYFSSLLIVLLAGLTYTPLIVVPILLGPVLVAYFLYVQKFKIGKWCSLCLVIHGVMLMQFLVLVSGPLLGGSPIADMMTRDVDPAPSLVMLAIAAFWSFLKPKLPLHREIDLLSRAHRNVIFSDMYLTHHMSSDSPTSFDAFDADLEIAGHPEKADRNEFGILISPSCPTCGLVLANVLPFLETAGSNTLNYRVRIIPSDETGFQVTLHVMAWARAGEPLEALKALISWSKNYEFNNVEDWQRSLGRTFDQEELDAAMNDLVAVFPWIEKSVQLGTPALFANGKPLPLSYVGSEILLIDKLSSPTLALPDAA